MRLRKPQESWYCSYIGDIEGVQFDCEITVSDVTDRDLGGSMRVSVEIVTNRFAAFHFAQYAEMIEAQTAAMSALDRMATWWVERRAGVKELVNS